MTKNHYLIAMAAGHGDRMGSSVPKQFMRLEGKAILHRTIQRFVDAVPDIQVVTVLPPEPEFRDMWRKYCLSENFSVPQTLAAGGITRFHSVRNALAHVPDGVVVAIHDGVRPFASETLIRSMFGKMENDAGCKALIPVVPVVDTLKVLHVEDGVLCETAGGHVDRSEIFSAQTPQVFRSECLKAAYNLAYQPSFTDDASVATAYKIPLTFVQGERYNLKITTPEDFRMAKAMIGSGEY